MRRAAYPSFTTASRYGRASPSQISSNVGSRPNWRISSRSFCWRAGSCARAHSVKWTTEDAVSYPTRENVVMCSMSSSDDTRWCFSSRSRARTAKNVSVRRRATGAGRTEEGEDVGVAREVVRADEALGERADGGLDRALGLDRGDGERGDARERAEDDEGEEGGGEHARGDLRAPVGEDRAALGRLAEAEVVLEPAAPDHVERRGRGPVDEVDEHAAAAAAARFLVPDGRVFGDVGAELGLEGGCDAPDIVIHVTDVVEGERGGDDRSHPSVLYIRFE